MRLFASTYKTAGRAQRQAPPREGEREAVSAAGKAAHFEVPPVAVGHRDSTIQNLMTSQRPIRCMALSVTVYTMLVNAMSNSR